MTTYIIRRLIQAMIVLVIVTSLIFLVMRLLPADPLMLYIAENELTGFTPEQMEALIHEWGLDKPLPVQYYEWISGVVRGDLGESIIFKAKVSDIIAERLPITLHLGILSFVLSSITGILAGVVSALRRGTWIDNTITPLANLGITTPAFWIGILMIYLFAFKLQWLPVFGYTSPFEDFWLSTRQSIMPVFVLSLMPLSLITRQTRSSILEVLRYLELPDRYPQPGSIDLAFLRGPGRSSRDIERVVYRRVIPERKSVGVIRNFLVWKNSCHKDECRDPIPGTA